MFLREKMKIIRFFSKKSFSKIWSVLKKVVPLHSLSGSNATEAHTRDEVKVLKDSKKKSIFDRLRTI